MGISVVTGGNRGLGIAVARRLARECGHVVIAARAQEAGREAADRLVREGFSASSVALDVTDSASVRGAAEEVADRHGHIDVLINNAGILPEAVHESDECVDLAMFRDTFETNLLGPVAVLEAFLPLLRRSDAGRIVNVSSTMGSLVDQTDPESPYFEMVLPAYQASKAALNSVTITTAKKLRDTTIKVTSVCPGFVRTGLTPMSGDAPLSAEEAAEIVFWAATLPADAASGGFMDANGVVPW